MVIETYGGGYILWHILNAVALICHSPEYLPALLSILLGVTALWIGMMAMTQADPVLFLKKFLAPTLAVLTLFYTAKEDVQIIDRLPGAPMSFSKVSNIPSGLAMVASYSSLIGIHLTQFIEEKAMPVGDTQRYSRTGPMFAAHLMMSARDVRIHDPVQRRNLKNFMNQCFTLPYILTNIAPGAKAAKEATDILAFVANAAHPNLGVYWADGTGNVILLQ